MACCCPCLKYGPVGPDGVRGPAGPAGPAIGQIGAYGGDYMYWSGTEWVVGSSGVHMGKNVTTSDESHVAIGENVNAFENSIVLNAKATVVTTTTPGLFLNPVRSLQGPTGPTIVTTTTRELHYDVATREVFSGRYVHTQHSSATVTSETFISFPTPCASPPHVVATPCAAPCIVNIVSTDATGFSVRFYDLSGTVLTTPVLLNWVAVLVVE